MLRSLSLLPIAALLAVPAGAQCFTATGTSIVPIMFTTGGFPLDDEGRSPDIAFNGFTFPMGGTNWSHFVVESNGEVYLTNGSGVVNPATFGISNLTEMRGGAGGSPRVVAFGGDNQGVAGLVGWDILVDDSSSSQVKISWTGMRFYAGTAQNFSMSVTLDSSGFVQFDYANGNFGSPNTADYCGVSIGNNVGTGTETSSDLSAPGTSGSLGLAFQADWGANPWDLDDTSVLFVPNGTGGYDWVIACGTPPNPPATHTSFGAGCYDRSRTFAELFPIAATALDLGTGITLAPNSPGAPTAYVVLPIASAIVTPTGTQVLNNSATPGAMGDDSTSQPLNLTSFSFPFSGGSTNVVHATSNGYVLLGATTTTGSDFSPSLTDLSGATTGTHAGLPRLCPVWYDLHAARNVSTNPASGVYFSEDTVNQTATITWLDVGEFATSTAGAASFTFQVQLSADGTVEYRYGTMSNFTSTTQAKIVGYTPGAPTRTPASQDFSALMPFQTSATESAPLALSASPTPVSTPTAGTALVYSVSDAPEFVPGSATTVGVLILSLNGNLPGFDLGVIGAGGCRAYVNSLDVLLTYVNAGSSATINASLPAGVPVGTLFYGQALALSVGVNAFGGVTSNGVESFVSDN